MRTSSSLITRLQFTFRAFYEHAYHLPIDFLLVIIYHNVGIVNSYTKLFLLHSEKRCDMISNNESICPKCGGELKYYDSVNRLVRTKYSRKHKLKIRRFRCYKCKTMHRELPDFIFPHKQYEADIIIGVWEGLITCETLGFEDYPCEMTMLRWMKQKAQMYVRKI